MSAHKFDCELGYFIREFEWLTNALQLFAFECRRIGGRNADRFVNDKAAKMTADYLIKELIAMHEQAVPEDQVGRTMLKRGLSFVDQVRENRNDVMHSLYMLNEQTVYAIKVKSVEIHSPTLDEEEEKEYKRIRQTLELRVGSLKKLIIVTNLLAQDFGRAIGHLREKISIRKAFLCSMGDDFSVPKIG